MQLVPNSTCLICDENTAVLTQWDTFIQYACDTFFKTNEHERNKFQGIVSSRSICVLCNYKITLAHKFKNIYEDICEKQHIKKFRPVCCFICESRTNEHFETEDNPNNFNEKIRLFMNCSSHVKKYKRRIACIDCSFYLSVWFEVYINISKKLNSNTQAHNSKNKMVSAHSDSADTSIKTNGDVSSSPADSTIKKTHHIDSDSSIKKLRIKLSKGFIVNVSDKKDLHKLLNETLNHLKSVEQISKKLNYDEDNIEDDKKMFKEIPYILVTKDKEEGKRARMSTPARPKPGPKSKKAKAAKKAKSSKSSDDEGQIVERKSRRINKESDVIVLSDTDDENKQERKNKRPVRAKPASKKPAAAPKGENRKGKPTTKNNKQSARLKEKLAMQKRTPFKIRLSSKFTLPPDSVVENKWHSCNICDKLFNGTCTFKTHKLWHAKPEEVVINLIRRELPDSIKASEYDPSKPIQKQSLIDMDTEENQNDSSKQVDTTENKEDETQSNTECLEDTIEQNDATEITIKEKSKPDNNDDNESVEKNDVAQKINGSNNQEDDDRETNENNDNREDEENDLQEEGENDLQKEGESDLQEEGESDLQEEGEKDLQQKEIEKNNEDNGESQEANAKVVMEDHQEEDEEDGSDKDEAAECNNHVNIDNQGDNDNEKGDENEPDHVEDDSNGSPKKQSRSIDDKVENIETKLTALHDDHTKERQNDESSPSLKRKRTTNSDVSDTEENTSCSSEKVTPKTKRVRFASDFETSADDLNNTMNNGTTEKNENSNKIRCSI